MSNSHREKVESRSVLRPIWAQFYSSAPEAALVAAGGVFVANLIQRMAVDIILFNVAQLWITALATAHTWRVLWPAEWFLPIAPSDLPGMLLRLAGCALLYYVMNVTMVSVEHLARLRDSPA